MIRRTAVVGLVFAGLLAQAGRVARAEDSAAEWAMRATFRIFEGTRSGTGFIVSVGDRLVLVTAAHVLAEMKGPECTLVLRAQAEGGAFARREVTLRIREGEKPLWVRHPDVDAAALFVTLPEGVDLKPFDYGQLADARPAAEGKIRVGLEVFVPCFPARLEANPAGWPVLRRGSIATHPLVPLAAAKTILVDYSEFGGDSGAPVVIQNGAEPLVVGLVIAMQRQTDKSSTPFEERTVHTPLGLAVVVQSPLVRGTVEMLLKK